MKVLGASIRNKGGNPLSAYAQGNLLLHYDGILNWAQTAGAQDALFLDQSGNGHHSEPVTTTATYMTWSEAGFSSVDAATETSRRAGVMLPESVNLAMLESDLTVEIVYTASILTGMQQVLFTPAMPTREGQLKLQVYSTYSTYFYSGTSTIVRSVKLDTPAGALTTAALTASESGGSTAYANGTPTGTGTDPARYTLVNPLCLGMNNSVTSALGISGTIHAMRIYTRRLTDEEIAANAALDRERYSAL